MSHLLLLIKIESKEQNNINSRNIKHDYHEKTNQKTAIEQGNRCKTKR